MKNSVNVGLVAIVLGLIFVPYSLSAGCNTLRLMPDTTSYIQTLDIESGEIDTVLVVESHFEAPNWHPDQYLVLNSRGKIYRFDLSSKQLSVINTGFATNCNNDHGISPDGKSLIISHNDVDDPSPKPYKSAIYKVPIDGGKPTKITSQVPSFWHGWSPDGNTIVYCAERNGNYDVYTMQIDGGGEKRLTSYRGLDDGPDYSPDGQFIYFNSYRSGNMQIWRMGSEGENPEQLTFDHHSNWFAHPAPNNRSFVYISYVEDQEQSHPFGKDVRLRLYDLQNGEIRDLTEVFFGGQGTLNVPSWSPDSKKIAFVSYKIR